MFASALKLQVHILFLRFLCTMDPDLAEELRRWRSTLLQEGDLPFEEAVDSLYTADPVIELRQKGPSRWTVFRKGSDDAAVFSYAMLFALSDDYFTGNLEEPLPRHEQAPPDDFGGDRIERYANFRCNYAYAFDTFRDKSIWSIIERLEEYALSYPGFKKTDLPRRAYDSPTEAGHARRFWMRAPMFVRRRRGERKPPPPAHIHPRVANADRRSSMYNANPSRPTIYTYDEETGAFSEVTESDVLLPGDIIVVAFTIYFVIGESQWFPVLVPAELVHVSPELVDAQSVPDDDELPLVTRRRLDERTGPPYLDAPYVSDGTQEEAHGSGPCDDDTSTSDGRLVPFERARSVESVSGIASSVAAMEVGEPEVQYATNQPVSDDDMDGFVFPNPAGTSGSTSASSSFIHPDALRDPRKTDSEDSQSSASSSSARGAGKKRKRPDGETFRPSPSGNGAGSDTEGGGDVGARRTRKPASRVRR